MSVIWFFTAVVFIVLWARTKSNNPSQTKTMSDEDYARGYWDGYRALAGELVDTVKERTIDAPLLNRLIDESLTSDDTPDETPNNSLDTTENRLVDGDTPRPQVAATALPIHHLMTKEDEEKEHERRTLRNLNTLLYMGSFLIVAAAGLFVTLVMPAAVKLFGLIFVTTAFYVSGLSLYERSPRLRPAAQAFVGTGLAIIPFIGFALTSLGGLSGPSAWFLTSIVGLVAYGFAAVRLQNEFISYVTMAFVLSLAMSAVSTLGLSIIWYFIVVIGVSLLCNSVSILWPDRVPESFRAPIERTGTITTPIALVASLMVGSVMDIYMYEVLFGITTAHYLVIWLEKRNVLHETIVRIAAHATLCIVAFDVSHLSNMTPSASLTFGLWWLGLALAQALYSLLRAPHGKDEYERVERLWTILSLVALAVGLCFWPHENRALWSALSIAVAGVVSLGAVFRFRSAVWTYPALAASVLFVYVIGRGAWQPHVPYEVLAILFACLAALTLAAYDRVASLGRSQSVKNAFLVATTVYGLFITLAGTAAHNPTTLGWATLLSSAIFVMLSYAIRSYLLEIVGALFALGSIATWLYDSPVQPQWQFLAWSVISAALLIVVALIHHKNQETDRRDSMIGVAAAAVGLLAFMPFYEVPVARTATAVLIIGAIAALAVRFVQKSSHNALATIAQASYALLPLAALSLAWHAGHGWIALVCAISAGILWLASYREALPPLFIVGNFLFFVALSTAWSWLGFSSQWLVHGVAWISTAVFYATYWFMVDKRDTWRQLASLISAWVVLGLSVIAGIGSSDHAMIFAAVGSLCTSAVLLAIEGYRSSNKTYVETAAYIATAGVQRIVNLLIPEANFVFYAHWWAIMVGLIAYWRGGDYTPRAVVALSFVTLSTGLYALQGVSGYSLVFLIEHIVILVAGAMLRKQWAMWWGVASVIIAVLYFLRGYTFLVLLFLGFLIILFVIWRLSKTGKS